MIEYLRRLFGRCQHKWEFVNMVKLNEFTDVNDEEEIVSAKEFSVQRCTHCRKTKYRKL